MTAGEPSRHVVIFTQNSFRDPLFAGPVIGPLRTLNRERRYRFHVISYEQDRYRLSAGEAVDFDCALAEQGIDRHPLDWGRAPFPARPTSSRGGTSKPAGSHDAITPERSSPLATSRERSAT